jgi:hypothetical protein
MAIVVCENCGNNFDKEQKYINAAEKKGRKHFCCLSCSTTYRNKAFDYSEHNKKLPQNQKGYKQKGKDPRSIFKWYIRRANHRKKNNGLTVDMLDTLWKNQKRLCAISRLPLVLHDDCTDNRYLASLDRIDSSLPYQEDNIQFIALPLNLAKQSLGNEEFISFLKEVSANL